MRLLLDTHAWLWFVLGDNSLSPTARALIENPAHDKLVSPASYWETAIKISTGKYALPQPFDQFISRAIDGQGFTILPVLPTHAATLSSMPFHHRDPFDRLLAAQSLVERMPIVGNDLALDAYGIQRFW
jgi:PIN domain nuclease of toxin-antitoxin system